MSLAMFVCVTRALRRGVVNRRQYSTINALLRFPVNMVCLYLNPLVLSNF